MTIEILDCCSPTLFHYFRFAKIQLPMSRFIICILKIISIYYVLLTWNCSLYFPVCTYVYFTGVTKQVGDALLLEGQQRTGRVVSIGIAPWGIVERNHELLGHNRDVPCHSISSPR